MEARRRDGELDISEPVSRAQDLETLHQVARTLHEIVYYSFEQSFSELPWPDDDSTLYFINSELRLADGELKELLHWLENILDDLGKVMATDIGSAKRKQPQTR